MVTPFEESAPTAWKSVKPKVKWFSRFESIGIEFDFSNAPPKDFVTRQIRGRADKSTNESLARLRLAIKNMVRNLNSLRYLQSISIRAQAFVASG